MTALGHDLEDVVRVVEPYFITDSEIATWQPAPDLVKGLLASHEVNLLFAPKNRGKTFLGLDLAYAIATNQPSFLGRAILQHGSVVYLCAEGRGGLVRRREAWRVEYRYDSPVPNLAFGRYPLDLRDNDDVTTLIQQVGAAYPDCVLVVIDTLSQHLPGGDEGTSDMSAALHSCQRIRDELNTTVLAIHHPSKSDESNERGGSGFRGGCADVLNITERDGVFLLVTQNARDQSTDDQAIPYTLDVVTLDRYRDENGFPLTSCVVRHLGTPASVAAARRKAENLDERVRGAFSGGNPMSVKEVASVVGKRHADVAKAVERLAARGVIAKDRPRGKWTIRE